VGTAADYADRRVDFSTSLRPRSRPPSRSLLPLLVQDRPTLLHLSPLFVFGIDNALVGFSRQNQTPVPLDLECPTPKWRQLCTSSYPPPSAESQHFPFSLSCVTFRSIFLPWSWTELMFPHAHARARSPKFATAAKWEFWFPLV